MRTFILFLIILIPHIADAQLTDNLSYDEIPVTINVQKVGSKEIPALIHGVSVYLPVMAMFDFLQIKNIQSASLDSVYGFFINPQAKYLIDKIRNLIEYEGKVYQVKPGDLIRIGTNLYLQSDYFQQVFGLDCQFNFRSLSVGVVTKIELPAIRFMRQQLMRQNISTIKGEKKADTTIENNFSGFRLGMADWGVNAIQQSNQKNSTKLHLGLGALVAGGEANFSLNYNTTGPFDGKQQYYNWRYVNNNNPIVRQINAGKIFAQSVSTIYAPVAGIQFTNAPTKYRKSFGSYRLSDKTEAGWTVELYVNNVLVNYTKADASGFFTFEVPLIYGNSVVKLRSYGPWGEEQVKEEYISLPFNFLPLRQFEYSVTAGVVSDGQKSKFARGVLNYGLGNHITIGAGMEYLSSVASGKSMPFVNASVRVGNNFLVTAEHVDGIRSQGIISYHLPSDYQLDFNYTKYEKYQTAIKFNYLEQREVRISKSFRGQNYAFFTRFSLNQYTLPKSKYSTAEFLISGIISGISSNLTTTATLNNHSAYINSNLSLTFKLPGGISYMPQAQYDFSQKRISMLRNELRKQISNRGYVNLSYQRDNFNKNNMFSVGMRLNFSFMQTSFSAIQSGHDITVNELASGSLMYDATSNYLGARRTVSVGKGGVIISPFLDLNCDGKRQINEPKLIGLKLHMNGGVVEHNNSDTTIRISGLEAYNSYLIEVDKNSFDNIAWRIKNATIRITIEPNHFKFIEVPVSVVAEVSGTVYLNDKNKLTGKGGFIVNIYDSVSNKIASTLSESDGYFSYMGLAPGHYSVRIDSMQLSKLKIKACKAISFKVESNPDGDIVDGLKFVLFNKIETVSNRHADNAIKHEAYSLQDGNFLKRNEPDKKQEILKREGKLGPVKNTSSVSKENVSIIAKQEKPNSDSTFKLKLHSKIEPTAEKLNKPEVKALKARSNEDKQPRSTLRDLNKRTPSKLAIHSKKKINNKPENKGKGTYKKSKPLNVQATIKKSGLPDQNVQMEILIKALQEKIEKMKEAVNEWIENY
ncbi:MAG: hypothetical protein ACTHJN_18020 [Ginsengibacter sp.]